VENVENYGTHSFRSGALSEILNLSLGEYADASVNRFSHVFKEAKTIGGWSEKSTAFRVYFKNSLKSTIIASRFVDPNSIQPLNDKTLIQARNFHDSKLEVPKTSKSDEEYFLKDFLQKLREKFIEKLELESKFKFSAAIITNIQIQVHTLESPIGRK
jgi:hypothetical protein